jgi:biofilm PGA synthesis N-glycosyltransferase PgaC
MVKGLRLTLLVSMITAALLCLLLVEREKVLLESELILQSFKQNLLITLTALYLTAFLAILLVRYVVLIVCSYLEFLRSPPPAQPSADDAQEPLPFVSVVVPAYNEGLVIAQSLRSLLELNYPHYEVLVVDDGSTDDTYERAMEVAHGSDTVPVQVITKHNGGKADALNVGIAHARGDFVFNMDGDTKLSRNTLRACIRHFDDPRVGAVAGNVKVLNRENALTRLQALEYVEGLAMVRKAQSFFRTVSIIPGPAGMFRKSALLQVRGYDSDTYAEDCDTTLKLLLLGWHISYEPTAHAWVETPSRLLGLIKQRYRWTRGILQAVRKYRSTLSQPRKGGVNFLILWYMVFESLLWPISNVAGNIFFAYIGLQYGLAVYLFYSWLQLTLLDIVAASYCLVLEDEDMSLLAYAPLFRVCYLLVMDVAKVLAAFEELRGLSMTWGKLEREGKLQLPADQPNRGHAMDPLSLLANLLLSITVGTLMVALVAYMAYKLREKRKPVPWKSDIGEKDETLVFLKPYVPDQGLLRHRAAQAEQQQ